MQTIESTPGIPKPGIFSSRSRGSAAVIIDQSMLSAEILAGQLRQWLSSRQELLARAEAAHRLDRPNALSRITELCLAHAGGVA